MGMVLPAPPAWLTGTRGAYRVAGLRRVASGWWVEVGDRAVLVGDLVGMAYLATLLSAPGRDHDVLALAAWPSNPSRPAPDPVLDRQALASYRRRAKELTTLLADRGLNPTRAASARRELADLTATLRGAIERGGWVRGFPTDQERARTAVRKALVRAVEAISAAVPELGDHLRASLTTGAVCRYDPAGGWTIQVR
jgi:hypothetical protein